MKPQIVFDDFTVVHQVDCTIEIYQGHDVPDDLTGEEDIEHVRKWGARLSMPGYLDCTDWALYDSEREAREGLAETFDLCPVCMKAECDRSLECLRREADDVCKWRGHDMVWEWNGAKCRVCGMGAFVDDNPPPNGIDVSGEAVGVNCRKDKSNDVT